MKPKILLALCVTIVIASSQNLTAQSWSLTGNAATNPPTNFLGTTDAKDLVLKTNNKERIRVNSNGNIGINYTGAPAALLDLRNTKQVNSLYLTNSSTNSDQWGIRSTVNGTNASALRTAGEFTANGLGSINTGLNVLAGSALTNYGGSFTAEDGATANIGVWGRVGGPGGSKNYAVYGQIAGFSAGNDFAGYFDGRTYTQSLLVGADAPAPSAAVNIQTSLTNGVNVVSTYASGNGVKGDFTGSPTNYYAIYGIAPTSGFNYAGYFLGNLHYTGSLTSFSDERLKENINPLSSVTDKIMQVNVSTYNFKKGYTGLNLPQVKQYGFIAQNLQKVFPELVQSVTDKSKGEDNIVEYKAVNYIGMIPILTRAFQEEHAQRLQTEQELKDLKQRLQNIEALLSQNAVSSSATQKTLNASTTAKLDQNAPNPFNQKSTISCLVPSNAKNATVVVYSSNGSKVKAFNNLSAGSNRLDINANTLAGGVYTYVLLVDGKQADSRQMIITK